MKGSTKKLLGLTAGVAALTYVLRSGRRKKLPTEAEVLMPREQELPFLLNEEDFSNQMQTLALPYLQERKETGYLASGRARLYYERYQAEHSRGRVVIVHGFTSGVHEYREMAYYFLKNGYSVDMMDHRGHGLSSREVEDLSKVTISSFEVYVSDLKRFVETIVKPSLAPGEKLFILGHSMGGGVTEMLLEQEQHLFDGAILVAPMVRLDFGKMSPKLAAMVVRLAHYAGAAQDYVSGYGAYDHVYDFPGSNYDSEPRYRYMYELLENEPRYRTSGGTYAWLAAAMAASDRIQRDAGRCVTPALLFQAQKDRMVSARAHYEFASEASDVTVITVPGAKHNLPFAPNRVLSPFMGRILEFFHSLSEGTDASGEIGI